MISIVEWDKEISGHYIHYYESEKMSGKIISFVDGLS